MSDELFLSIVTDPETVADPYPRLRQLRETAPVHKVGFSSLWVLTSFEDCRQALRDHRLGIARAGDETPSLMPGAVFSRDPDRFDVGRGESPLLSFGVGIHECLGTALARLQGQVVLRALLDRFETWTPLDDNPPWNPRLALRGLARLRVAFS